MSATLLFRRFLADPMRVAYVLPSSKKLIRRVLRDLDFHGAKVFVEFGGGEGCYTRELVKRLAPDAKLFVFEIDAELAAHLRKQFRGDDRVIISQTDAAHFRDELKRHGFARADYVISGIPFSYIPAAKKKAILHAVHEGLDDAGIFFVYQLTAELKGHGRMFAACETEYFFANIPPIFLLSFHKTAPLPKSRRPRKPARHRVAA